MSMFSDNDVKTGYDLLKKYETVFSKNFTGLDAYKPDCPKDRCKDCQQKIDLGGYYKCKFGKRMPQL